VWMYILGELKWWACVTAVQNVPCEQQSTPEDLSALSLQMLSLSPLTCHRVRSLTTSDHHHLVRACCTVGIHEAAYHIVKDMSKASEADFWAYMQGKNPGSCDLVLQQASRLLDLSATSQVF
jgi:hypothetical protein